VNDHKLLQNRYKSVKTKNLFWRKRKLWKHLNQKKSTSTSNITIC